MSHTNLVMDKLVYAVPTNVGLIKINWTVYHKQLEINWYEVYAVVCYKKYLLRNMYLASLYRYISLILKLQSLVLVINTIPASFMDGSIFIF